MQNNFRSMEPVSSWKLPQDWPHALGSSWPVRITSILGHSCRTSTRPPSFMRTGCTHLGELSIRPSGLYGMPTDDSDAQRLSAALVPPTAQATDARTWYASFTGLRVKETA